MAIRFEPLLRLASDEDLVERVRAGSDAAFETLFDRHHRGLLAFCRHMLGSAADAEDAVQHTFMAAYADLMRSDKPIALRPWLYTIARHRCLSVLRARRERLVGDLPEDAADQLATEVDTREELRATLADIARLPEDQRAALVLAELGDASHAEIAQVLDCRHEKVKALVFQARSALATGRTARDTACADIREQLAVGGSTVRRALLREHVRDCAGCREFDEQLRIQRRRLRILLPVLPSFGLKRAVLGAVAASGGGGAAVGAGALGAGGVAAIVSVAILGGGGAAEPADPRAAAAKERPRAAAPAQTAAPALTPVAAPAPAARVRRVVATNRRPKRSTVQPRRRATRKPASPTNASQAPAVPPGQAKKVAAPKPAAPPGQVKKVAAPKPAAPPGQVKKLAVKPAAPIVPPGQANKPAAPVVPPGQAKKVGEPAVPPGQAKKDPGATAAPAP